MAVRKLDITKAAFGPEETKAPSVIHPDRVLRFPVTLQRLKPIGRWHPQIFKLAHRVENDRLSAGDLHGTGREAFSGLVRRNIPDQLAFGTLNHARYLSNNDTCIKM